MVASTFKAHRNFTVKSAVAAQGLDLAVAALSSLASPALSAAGLNIRIDDGAGVQAISFAMVSRTSNPAWFRLAVIELGH